MNLIRRRLKMAEEMQLNENAQRRFEEWKNKFNEIVEKNNFDFLDESESKTSYYCKYEKIFDYNDYKIKAVAQLEIMDTWCENENNKYNFDICYKITDEVTNKNVCKSKYLSIEDVKNGNFNLFDNEIIEDAIKQFEELKAKIKTEEEQKIRFNKLIENEKPTQKDLDRAEGLQFLGNGHATFHGSGAPWKSEASKIAKLIKDPAKLVRRAKAVIEVYSNWRYFVGDKECDVWTPFKEALLAMGFSYGNVADIENKKYA